MQAALSCLVLTGLFLLGSTAWAKNACVFEGNLQGVPIKDCSEIDLQVPPAEYKQQCEQNEKAFKEMGGQIHAYVVPACPKPAQASCAGAMGSPGTVYYYLVSPQDLEKKKASCLKYQGKWQAGMSEPAK
ncbi:hypothetical protein [Chitinimonas sp. BJB300]|uniref:hypothetical protein n=1 Tax=Chitinimonas sp. BJB300 TaxID=1559339 RepID=UPI000C11C465|nr:hypothetical protein [Chitinimonas sp. BJB300]PHV10503.1 hypothetical protein CSQ89_15805 [Chitinimonas sp. BJB300]TSJ90750.1 hypothetical protein FG002_000025 [Chitinimonas sp. BJB300]